MNVSPGSPAYSLLQLLSYAEYSKDGAEKLIAWFLEHIEPTILPAFHGTTKWRPSLTWNHSPFEPSLNIANREHKTVRFGIEPVSDQANTAFDPFNQHATQKLLHGLHEHMPHLDLVLFDHLFREFTVPEAEEIVKTLSSSGRLASSHFCAFDLGGDDTRSVAAKVYFILERPVQYFELSPLTIVQQAVRNLDQDHGTDFSKALTAVCRYLETDQSFILPIDVEMLAVDCKSLDKAPRLKVYAHSYTCSFECVEHVLTMGGLLAGDGETNEHLSLLQELWHTMFDDVLPTHADKLTSRKQDSSSTAWKSHRLKPTRDLNGRIPEFIFSFEIRSGDATPEIKFYLPVRFYNASDIATAHRLAQFLAARGWTQTAKEYEQLLRNTLPHNDLDSSGGTHTYVAVAFSKKKGAYVTMYWQPSANSTDAAHAEE